MAIPALDDKGLLPLGVHDCSWQEVQQAFCWNPHREMLFGQAQSFLRDIWSPLGLSLPIWLDGSFTRRKDSPADIDLVIEATSLDAQQVWPVAQIWFQREQYKDAYSVDFWFKHPMFPHDLCAFFQYTGIKAGAELQLDAKHIKGILKVLP